MKITATMNLSDLAERMGDATEADAERMRDLLVERYDGQDTADIAESDWLAMLDATQASVTDRLDALNVPGCAMQVYAGWVWMIGSDELGWTKSGSRETCERTVLEFVERRGVDALTADE